MFCINKSATNEFKSLLLIEEAHLRTKPRYSSTRPIEASKKRTRSIQFYLFIKLFGHFVQNYIIIVICFEMQIKTNK